MDQDIPQPPPNPSRPSPSGPENDAAARSPAAIKKLDANDGAVPSKRPRSSFAADYLQSGSTSDSLVSSWLDGVYPPDSKRQRRYSASAIDASADLEDDNNDKNQVQRDTSICPDTQAHPRAISEPDMFPQDDNFVRPITPGSYHSFQWPRGQSVDRGRSISRSGGSSRAGSAVGGGGVSRNSSASRGSSLIETDDYRRLNLAFNNSIIYCPTNQVLPASIRSLVDMIEHKTAPANPAEAAQLDAEVLLLEEDYYRPMEATVRKAFDKHVFVEPGASDNLQRADDQPMNKRAVPTKLTVTQFAKLSEQIRDQHRISTPIPDILYGYSARGFSINRQRQMAETLGTLESSNATFLRMPFLLVEFKGDGGSMWGCTNQCMGGAASCVNIGERLAHELASRDLTPFNSAVFSIAMNGFEARLFVSWRHVPVDSSQSELGAGFNFQRLRSFHLNQADQYQEFKRYVRNIIDWGTGERFGQIENALDELSAKRRRRNSFLADSATPGTR